MCSLVYDLAVEHALQAVWSIGQFDSGCVCVSMARVRINRLVGSDGVARPNHAPLLQFVLPVWAQCLSSFRAERCPFNLEMDE